MRPLRLIGLIALIALAGIIVFGTGGFPAVKRVKFVEGYVRDCDTNEPIDGAEISDNQRGWGHGEDGSLIWDKSYRTAATTDSEGRFRLEYKVGNAAQLRTKHEGYFTAVSFADPNTSGKIISMRKGTNPLEYTYNCRLSSECLVTETINNVQSTKNICDEQN